MRKNVREYEISGIILAITIIAMIIVVAIKSPTLEYVLLAGLIGVTTWYAYSTIKIARATKQQADASVEMAKEMREQRYDTVRPVIDIQREPLDEDKLPEAFAGKSGDTSRGLACVLRNIGLGPAIDMHSFVQNPFVQNPSDRRQRFEFGTLATGEKTHKMNLSVKQEDGRMALLAYYKDVYERTFESSREVSVDKEKGWQLGPLKIRPVMEGKPK